MPSKKVKVREYVVRAHERVIHSRRYKFICAECDRAVERESFGPRPIYCLDCRPPKEHHQQASDPKKRPRPVLVHTDNRSQDTQSHEAS